MKQTVGIKELGKRSIELGSATLLGAILVLSPHLIATAATTKSQCEGVFASDAKAKPAKRTASKSKASNNESSIPAALEMWNDVYDESMNSGFERISLSEMWDPDSNFIKENPMVLRTGAQRMLAAILQAGSYVKEVANVGKVRVYNIFSHPNQFNDGKIIVGHEAELAEFVSIIEATAKRNQRKAPMFIGPSGTGKSLTLENIAHAMTVLAKATAGFKNYTISWDNLKTITDDKDISTPDIDMIYASEPSGYRSQTNESPYAILPGRVQSYILQQAKKNQDSNSFWSQLGPLNPVDTPDPQSAKLMKEVLYYYTQKKREKLKDSKAQLSVAESLEALQKHISIVTTEFQPTVIGSQAEPNFNSLFAKKDNLLSNILPGRARNPLAWEWGTVARANGLAILWDEYPRNGQKLLDATLPLLESNFLEQNGSPGIYLDLLHILAGNYESFEKLAATGGFKAQKDRIASIIFGWLKEPYNIAKTALVMQGQKNVLVRDLSDPEAEYEKADWDKIIPIPSAGEEVKTTDLRYDVVIDGVHINPRTLLLYGTVVGGTRISTDTDDAKKVASGKISVTSPIFRSRTLRMKYYMGTHKAKNDAEKKDLHQLSDLLHEGQFGISMRDANDWLNRSIAYAKEYNDNELTPEVLGKVFKWMLDNDKIDYNGDQSLRDQWLATYKMMTDEIVIPLLKADVFQARAEGKANLKAAYDEIFIELMTEASHQTEYTHPVSKQERRIDTKRLDAIRKIYFEINRDQLDMSSVAMMLSMSQTRGENSEIFEPLYMAVKQYYASKAAEDLDLLAIIGCLENGNGEGETLAASERLLKTLQKMGYSEKGAIEALYLVQQLQERGRGQ